jgi:trk system potassium uptake protein TrkA
MVEFDVPDDAKGEIVGRPLREARLPADAKVAGIIRGERVILPRGDIAIERGDRIVVIGSPDAAREWSELLAQGKKRLGDVVIFGAGQMGTTIARVLLERSIRVRLVDARRERAHEVAELGPRITLLRTLDVILWMRARQVTDA